MTESATKGKVSHYSEIPGKLFGEEAPGVTIRRLIDDEHDGAPVYSLRMIEVGPGGHTPRHEHPYEHENYVIDGQGKVLIGEEWHEIGPGVVVYVPPGVEHTYVNEGPSTLRFLCGIPVPGLRQETARE